MENDPSGIQFPSRDTSILVLHKVTHELAQSKMNSDLVPSKPVLLQQFDIPGDQMRRKQSMACKEMEEATAPSPLGEDCSGGTQAGGHLCW